MTRGQRGWLDPFAVGDLHSFPLCRFVSAHPNATRQARLKAGARDEQTL
jgi:hypothetical protein